MSRGSETRCGVNVFIMEMTDEGFWGTWLRWNAVRRDLNEEKWENWSYEKFQWRFSDRKRRKKTLRFFTNCEGRIEISIKLDWTLKIIEYWLKYLKVRFETKIIQILNLKVKHFELSNKSNPFLNLNVSDFELKNYSNKSVT